MTKARTLADNFAADINGITAGTGITGGGTSGTVTVTNSMATAIDAKGDLVVGTGADTFSRLAVASTAGYLLSVDSAEATGLKWAAPASGSTFAGARVWSNATQSLSNATWTVKTYNQEEFDTDGFHDNVTNNGRLTVPAGKGGYYLIYATSRWADNSTGRRISRFIVNGTHEINAVEVYPVSGGPTYTMASVLFDLAAGDYVVNEMYQSSGGALNADMSDFSMSFGLSFQGA